MKAPSLKQSTVDLQEDFFSPLSQHLFEDWSDYSVYALLDGASVPGLPELLDDSGLSYSCLYSGDLVEELARAAPYIVRLEAHHPLTQRILAQGWGQHWCVFIASREDLTQLRKHFRQFLRVLSPEGKTLYFRFYDPRVLRTYLPSCQSQELVNFFGPCVNMAMEGRGAKALLDFRIKDAPVSTSKVSKEVGA